MIVWVVYYPLHEKVLGVFSTEEKASAFCVRYNEEHDGMGTYEAVYGPFEVDDEHAKTLGL